jgi:hypothetical protein
MAEHKLSAWRLVLGLVLFLPGAGMLLLIASSQNGPSIVHEMMQRVAHGYTDIYTDNRFWGFEMSLAFTVVGCLLIRSAFKRTP